MKKAGYNHPLGPLVTPEEFEGRAGRDWKEKDIFPYCPLCKERVSPYGIHSTSVPSRFDHPDREEGADPLDDCELSNRDGRLKGFGIDDLDLRQSEVVRSKFFEDDNLRLAYAFCHKMCGVGSLPREKFIKMIKRADRKNIWSYVDVPIFVIPYILLTLENFTGKRRDNSVEYDFYFAINKPHGEKSSVFWRRPESCAIEKRFCGSDKPFKVDGNPYPISEEALRVKAGKIDWIGNDFIQQIKRAA